jgi:hypothetical protein
MNAEMRKHALRRYLVFRVKLIEFLDMAAIWELLRTNKLQPPNPASRQPKDFADSLQTVLLSWFALFVDKNALNVIELWKELFPKRRDEVEATWNRIKSAWDVLRRFRDSAGFHADKPSRFFNARREKSKNHAMLMEALAEFQRLQGVILKAESTELTDFPSAVDAFLDEQEAAERRYNRAEFKRYLMIGVGNAKTE